MKRVKWHVVIRETGLALMLLALFLGWKRSGYREVLVIWELFIPGIIIYIFARVAGRKRR